MIRALKLTIDGDSELSSEDILSVHLGYFMTHGKVMYSTKIKVAEKPDYVLLVLGNVDDICYLCHVSDYAYESEPVEPKFREYSPDRYKDEEKNKTWFIFDSMQKIPIDFLDEILPDNTMHNFIKDRANNKVL